MKPALSTSHSKPEMMYKTNELDEKTVSLELEDPEISQRKVANLSISTEVGKQVIESMNVRLKEFLRDCIGAINLEDIQKASYGCHFSH